MDTDRLRYFCVVSRTGNVHRASELLGLSPAAVSRAVKTLESEMGVALTVAAGRGIVLTEEGRRLAARAERILEEMEQLKGEIRGTTGTPLRVGSFEVFTTHLLTKWMPDEPLLLQELVPGKLEEALSQGAVDIGVTYIPIPHPDLDFLKVASLRMGVFCRKNSFEKTSLGDVPFVVPATPVQGSPTRVRGLDGWPDGRVPRMIRHRVTLLESALELCRNGIACGYLPSAVVQHHNALVKKEFALVPHPERPKLKAAETTQPVYLVKRKSLDEGRDVKRLAKQLRILFRE